MDDIVRLIESVLIDCGKDEKSVCNQCRLGIYKDDWCGCTGPDALKAILYKKLQSSASKVRENE